MKEKLFKKSTSVVALLIIFAMIATMFLPSYVKSAQVVVASATSTGRGIGSVDVYKAAINGYSNLYCVRGGARLEAGMQLNDNGVSLYNTTGSVVSESSAIQWLLDNMYLTEGTDATTQSIMKENLKSIMRAYNAKTDANGNSLLNKKLNGNGISDAWISSAVDNVISDPSTLYAIQQFAIWKHVYNYETKYNNVMENSNGTYNAIPNATANRTYYTALYITLAELSAEAQRNGYKSPNLSTNGFNIQLQVQGNVKNTIAGDKKSIVFGPYKLANNTSMVSKKFTATVNSENADKIETVDANGSAVSVSSTQGEFYFKVTYNKGFSKGVDYKINVNVALNGIKTTATLLDAPVRTKQPLVTISKSPYTASGTASTQFKEELNGDYNLKLEKVDSTDPNKKLEGVTFKVKVGSGEEKSYGPTGSDGLVTVVDKKTITEQNVNEVDEYTISKEISLGSNEGYVKIAEPITVYVKKTNNGQAYVLASASFDKNSEVKSKQVQLKDGTTAVASVSISGNTVTVTVPNKPKDEPKDFDMALRKYITEIKRNGQNVDVGTSRKPRISASSASEYLSKKTAGYYHIKDPITVQSGDTVIYTMTVYNEGYLDGYAKEVTDYLPAELEFVEDSEINRNNGWTATKNADGTTTVKTSKLNNDLIPAAKGASGFLGYASQLSTGHSTEPEFSRSLQVECKVKKSKVEKLLVNVAEITNYGYKDENGNYVEANKEKVDIDSEENNVYTKNGNVNSIDSYYQNIVKPQYKQNKNDYVGMQDDDDFENIIVLPEIELKGDYTLQLEKVDSTDPSKKLAGVTFNVKVGSEEAKAYGPTGSDGLVTIVDKKQITEQNVNDVDEYTISSEIDLGNNGEYARIAEPITVYITKASTGKNYIASKVSFSKDKEITSKEVTLEDGSKAVVKVTLNNNIVTVTIPNKPKKFDLALRKYITEVIRDGKNLTIENRTPVIKEESAKAYESNKTADYFHTKNPITVRPGDTVIYTLRVYNEGEINGFAKEVTDYLPAGLEYVENSNLNKENGWTITKNPDGTTVAKTTKLNSEEIKAANGKEGFEKYAKEVAEGKTDAPEFSKAVQIECKVKDDVDDAKLLVNVAEITNYGYNDRNGNYVEANESKVDIDSEENNVFTINGNVKNIDEYYENVVKKQETTNNYKGIQDDDDFENVIVEIEKKEFDLALRKYITQVVRDGKNVSIEDRTPVINEESAKAYETNKTADYFHTKNTITVKPGDTVIYTLRVYNEGEVNGFAKEITDYLPAGLEYVENSKLNKENGWKVTKNQNGTSVAKTNKLNSTEIVAANGKEGFEKYAKEAAEGKTDAPEFSKAVQIECKVKEDIEDAKLLVNVAEITNYGYIDRKGNYVEANKTKVDIDSEENNVFTINNNIKSINEYYQNVIKKQMSSSNKNYKGIQDDDDFESVKVKIDKKFDLALRKFITAVTNNYGKVENVKTRIPVFKVDKNGKYVYEHSKEPVLVANDNIVTYTIRVYNEGEINGYAEQVKDDIPEGLEFVPQDKTNVEYRWVMLDKDNKETTDPSKAKYIVTDYLSIEQEKTKGTNLIKAFNLKDYESGAIKEPDYKEVKVSFKVNAPDKSEEIIINHAQISEDLDENGKPVDDIDSTPNKWIDGDDDQDIEPVKVQWFDLSLRKWVTKAIVIENGVETVTETGHKAEDNPESVVKVDLKTSSINDITVKFEYKIRVKNESPIAGYAKEVKDYIPEGLKFVKEDNPDWKEVEEGVIVTDALKDTLLKKDETAEVTVVLTWINSEDNMGVKVNVAEISKDYNKYGAKDVDSTPDNKVPGEDDIDDAPVMLTPKTGEEATYVILSVAVLTIIAGGLVAIKKFVL